MILSVMDEDPVRYGMNYLILSVTIWIAHSMMDWILIHDRQDHKVGPYDPVRHGCIGRVFRGRCLHDRQDHKVSVME